MPGTNPASPLKDQCPEHLVALPPGLGTAFPSGATATAIEWLLPCVAPPPPEITSQDADLGEVPSELQGLSPNHTTEVDLVTGQEHWKALWSRAAASHRTAGARLAQFHAAMAQQQQQQQQQEEVASRPTTTTLSLPSGDGEVGPMPRCAGRATAPFCAFEAQRPVDARQRPLSSNDARAMGSPDAGSSGLGHMAFFGKGSPSALSPPQAASVYGSHAGTFASSSPPGLQPRRSAVQECLASGCSRPTWDGAPGFCSSACRHGTRVQQFDISDTAPQGMQQPSQPQVKMHSVRFDPGRPCL